MNLEALKLFYALSNYKSFSEAADGLFISRHALMRSINNLENELGCLLLIRDNAGIHLTDFGNAFLDQVIPFLDAYEKLTQLPKDFHPKPHPMTIGIHSQGHSSSYALARCIEGFCQHHPEYSIETVISDPYSIETQILDGELNFGFAVVPPKLSQLSYLLLLDLELVLLVNNKNPLASLAAVAYENLKKEKLVIPRLSGGAERVLNKYLGESIMKNIVLRTDDMTLFYRLVSNNSLSGVLSIQDARIGRSLYNNLSIVHMDPPLNYSLGVIYKQNTAESKADSAFIEYVKQNYNKEYNIYRY